MDVLFLLFLIFFTKLILSTVVKCQNTTVEGIVS